MIAGKNLVLIGFMGTGKTEVGRLLAEALNRRFLDTDQIIEVRQELSVREIFELHGEPYFRELERELVAELGGQRGLVLATGGGLVLTGENVATLKRHGFLVWLHAGMEEIAERLSGDTTRPLLDERRKEEVAALYRQREPLYRGAADMRVATTGKTPLYVCREIIKALCKGNGEGIVFYN